MKSLSLLLTVSVLALSPTASYAKKPTEEPAPCKDPKPGKSDKCTRVDFDHDNNGWGNGDQNAPGNSGDHNNAENGPKSAPGSGKVGTNTQSNGLVANQSDDATQKELERIEREAASKNPEPSANSSVKAVANNVVARRAK